ncbi:hypothetical protein LJC11_05630, partial [Bacteroidales bacterium OttesenSCG-928-I21]|nr:hypothetical protein [Bacteroidales bacterium OttesenSCG-928-I21]
MIFKIFRKGLRAAKTRASIRRIRTIENLVETKAMLFNTGNYHVAMLDNLWNMYKDKSLIDFCENLIFYCDFKNALDGKKVDNKKKKTLLVSLKFEN